MATFTDNELRSFLEKIPLFSSIPYNQLRWIAKLFEPVSVKKGSTSKYYRSSFKDCKYSL